MRLPLRFRNGKAPINLGFWLSLFQMSLCTISFAQQKGGGFIQDGSTKHGKTYAVVIGISDYQDPLIPDLYYADKDAIAFSHFLRSSAGGEIEDENLILLTNQDATAAQFAMALDWLWEVAKEGDRVIIYFSGHGDVERKSITQPGYLLCWDAPHHPYMAGGAINIRDLKDVISTLSLQNKAKVILITDACRAGKLSGSHLGGTQATAASLSQQFANEIKILSCQPDEYSVEGMQWGGGRGAFSYHLLNGLYGLADGNEDDVISLMEIGRYLEDNVSTEVAPSHQLPMTVGNGRENMAYVIPELREQIRQDNLNQMAIFASIETKGLADIVLEEVDSSTKILYTNFLLALEKKAFLEPLAGDEPGDYAEAYYRQLIHDPSLEALHSSIRRNFAAALQDDAQQVLNKWLGNDIEELELSRISKINKYKNYPAYLSRASELLGEDHYMYSALKARAAYFFGFLLHIDNLIYDPVLGKEALNKYREALRWQADLPQVYSSMSQVYFYQMSRPDSAAYYANKAISAAPGWIAPYSNLGNMYSNLTINKDLDSARHYLQLADQLDSSAVISNLSHMNNWAIYSIRANNMKKAEKIYPKMIAVDSTLAALHNYVGVMYLLTSSYDKAKYHFLKCIELDSTWENVYINLGDLYLIRNNITQAEKTYEKALSLNPLSGLALTSLAKVHIRNDQFEAGEAMFNKAIAIDPTQINPYLNIGNAYFIKGRPDLAIEKMEGALEVDSTSSDVLGYLGYIYLSEGDSIKAVLVFNKLLKVGMDLARKGDYQNARAIFLNVQRFYKPYIKYAKIGLATIYATHHQIDRAFIRVDKAFNNGYTLDDPFVDLAHDPVFAPLRARSEQWEELLRKYGLK